MKKKLAMLICILYRQYENELIKDLNTLTDNFLNSTHTYLYN